MLTVLNSTLSSGPTVATRRPLLLKIRALAGMLSGAESRWRLSFTPLYGRGGDVEHGVVMLRTQDDRRTLARIPASDSATLARLLDMDRTPVGSLGNITMAADGVPEWRVA